MCYLRLLFLIDASPRNVLSGKEQGETVTTSWAAFFVFFVNFLFLFSPNFLTYISFDGCN